MPPPNYGNMHIPPNVSTNLKTMRTLRTILLFILFTITACDPAHNGFFENGSSNKIKVIIPDYLYPIEPGIIISSYPYMNRIDSISEQVSIIDSAGHKYLSATLNSKESLLVSYSLGIRPHTDRNIYYQVINEIDTILLHEKEIFSLMKKRDNSRFKYYFSYTSN